MTRSMEHVREWLLHHGDVCRAVLAERQPERAAVALRFAVVDARSRGELPDVDVRDVDWTYLVLDLPHIASKAAAG